VDPLSTTRLIIDKFASIVFLAHLNYFVALKSKNKCMPFGQRVFFIFSKLFAQYIYSNTLEGEKDLYRGACSSFSFLNTEVT
jgi:hypothetical protein